MTGEARSSIRLVDGAPPMERKAGILRIKRNAVPLDRRIVHDTAIENLEIDGNRAHQRQDVGDAEKKYGLYAEVHDCIMRHVMVRDCMGYGFDPHGTVDLKPSKRILIEDCVARGNLKDGFTLDQQEDMVMRNCLSEGNGRAGINIVTSSLNSLFEYNSILNNAGPGVFVQNGSHSTLLRRNRIIGNGHNGVFLRGSQSMRLTDNYIALNMHGGVRVNGGKDISIRENMILKNLADGKTQQSEVFLDLHDGVGPDRVEVDCNHIDARRNAAVMDCPDASGTRVTDNVYDSAAPNGIVLQAQDAMAEGNLRLQRDRWFGTADPLAQIGTNWLTETRNGAAVRR
jgi:hypothetical protein